MLSIQDLIADMASSLSRERLMYSESVSEDFVEEGRKQYANQIIAEFDSSGFDQGNVDTAIGDMGQEGIKEMKRLWEQSYQSVVENKLRTNRYAQFKTTESGQLAVWEGGQWKTDIRDVNGISWEFAGRGGNKQKKRERKKAAWQLHDKGNDAINQIKRSVAEGEMEYKGKILDRGKSYGKQVLKDMLQTPEQIRRKNALMGGSTVSTAERARLLRL